MCSQEQNIPHAEITRLALGYHRENPDAWEARLDCPKCKGEGWITFTSRCEESGELYEDEDSCPECHGEQKIEVKRRYFLVLDPSEDLSGYSLVFKSERLGIDNCRIIGVLAPNCRRKPLTGIGELLED